MEDQAHCKKCMKLFQRFEDSNILKLEASDFESFTQEIYKHLKSIMLSSTGEHQHSFLSQFVSKVYMYLSNEHVYKLSAENLIQMFKLFIHLILSRTKFTKLHPKHLNSNKEDELYLRLQLLGCFEIHGCVDQVKTIGLKLLETEMKNVQLPLSVDYCKIIIPMIQILVDLAMTNTDGAFLVKLIPLLKFANHCIR